MPRCRDAAMPRCRDAADKPDRPDTDMDTIVSATGQCQARSVPAGTMAWASDRLTATPLAASDRAFYECVYGDPDLMRHIGSALTAGQARASFHAVLAGQGREDARHYLWVLREAAGASRIGLLGLVRDRETPSLVEPGAIIVSRWQRRGLALEALRSLLVRLPSLPMSTTIRTLRLRHRADNIGAERICIGLGFSPARQEGDWRIWHHPAATPRVD